MVHQADLDRLRQGVTAWNEWREAYPDIQPDLSQADLNGADLGEANFHRTNFVWTRLGGATLTGANLSHADLTGADLSDTDLTKVNLSQANLSNANLVGADLREANLSQTNLRRTDLIGANLVRATLRGASLYETDLSVARGLEEVKHFGPSTIGIDTIYRSQGMLPEIFLRGAGIPLAFIASIAPLFGRPTPYRTCLIRYGYRDQAFAEQLCADLQHKGIRCWLTPKDDEMGENIRSPVDNLLHSYDQLILVFSGHSVQSVWIEKEVRTAFEKEAQQARRVLFPIHLDDTVLQTTAVWATDLGHLRQRGDFCGWKQQEQYQQALSRLFGDLTEGIQQRVTEAMD